MTERNFTEAEEIRDAHGNLDIALMWLRKIERQSDAEIAEIDARYDDFNDLDPVDVDTILNAQERAELFAGLEFEPVTISPEQHAALAARIHGLTYVCLYCGGDTQNRSRECATCHVLNTTPDDDTEEWARAIIKHEQTMRRMYA